MQAIILAGGFGTRLAGVVKDVPKPMAPVADVPFLDYIVRDLYHKGITKIVMAVGYKQEVIRSWFRDNYCGVPIEYSDEDTPLYTGGAVKKAFGLISFEHALVVNGDTFFDVNLPEMESKFIRSGAEVSIAIKRMRSFSRYGEVKTDKNGFIVSFLEKTYCDEGYINGGIYILKKACVQNYEKDIFSMENDLFPLKAIERKMSTFESDGMFIDIGIPEDYERAQTLFKGVKI